MTPEDETPTGQDPATGRFLPGNTFWRRRSTCGPAPRFETPEALRQACVEYFEDVVANPLEEEQLFNSGGRVLRATSAKMRPMTIQGMCIFIGISRKNWADYRARAEYQDVCEWVQNVIFVQKYEGAAAGFFNQAIIARELGLVDKHEESGEMKVNIYGGLPE